MEHCGLRSRLFCLQGRRSPEWTKTPKLQRSDSSLYDPPCIGAVFSLPFCITKIHDPFISGFEPYYKYPTFAFATEIIAVRATSLTFRTLYSEQDFWIMWAVICFCCKCPVLASRLKMSDSNRSSVSLTQRAPLTPHFSNPSGNRTRASGATVRCTGRYTMELYILLVSAHRKSRLFFGQAAFQHQSLRSIWLSRGSHKGSQSQTSTWSGLMKAYTNKPFRVFGGRHSCPLEIKQAIWFFHFVCMYLQHSLSFPDPWSFFTAPNITPVVSAVIQLVV